MYHNILKYTKDLTKRTNYIYTNWIIWIRDDVKPLDQRIGTWATGLPLQCRHLAKEHKHGTGRHTCTWKETDRRRERGGALTHCCVFSWIIQCIVAFQRGTCSTFYNNQIQVSFPSDLGGIDRSACKRTQKFWNTCILIGYVHSYSEKWCNRSDQF